MTNDWVALFWIVVGILLSVAVPVAIRTVLPTTRPEGMTDWLADTAKPYLKMAGASTVLGLLTLAIVKYSGGHFSSWPQALMAGYLWDSTVQKFKQS